MNAGTTDDRSEVDLRQQLADRLGVPPREVRRIVSPYRICPVGAHVDHQGGAMLGMAIDAATELVFVASDQVDLESANFDGRVTFDPVTLGAVEFPEALPEWGRYVWAALSVLRDRLPAVPRGFTGRIQGSLPGSGLSSSASVLLAYLAAWAEVNDVTLTPREQVLLSQVAENRYVGVQSGILDPASIVGGRRGQLLAIDSSLVQWEPVPLGREVEGACFLVLFAGRERSLRNTDFNLRVEECQKAASWAATRLARRDARRLGEVGRESLRGLLDEMPGVLGRRARHFVEEGDRVERARWAWADGDLDLFGQIMSDSCRSSIENYETGSEELVTLQTIWESTPGVLGARFSGAGFGGSSVALVDPAAVESISRSVLDRFCSAQPALASSARIVRIESADGLAFR